MKTKHFEKKYKLFLGTKFNHNKFAKDFYDDFISRMEYEKEFNSNWGHNIMLDLLDYSKDRWDLIDNKTMGNLPKSLYNYIRYKLLEEVREQQFPEMIQWEEEIKQKSAKELVEEFERMGIRTTGYYGLSDASFEWDGKYTKGALGDLNLRPNRAWHDFNNKIYDNNVYEQEFMFKILTYQLKKLGASKANRQFKIHLDYEKRRSERRSWFDQLLASYQFSESEYTPYFSLLNLDVKLVKDASEIKSAFKKLSLRYHPDKGGSKEKFIEITEAKNKALEYFNHKNK